MTGLQGKGAFVAGSDKPERSTVRVGFMPLTDCASLVMASVLGLDEKYGIRIVLSREQSWSGMRDRLVRGELDCAQLLYAMVYAVELGVGTAQKSMALLMNLNQNGQAITLSRALAARGAVDGAGLAALMANEARRFTFAHTFPTGNHALWLYYWLAAAGIEPMSACHVATVPPNQMAANLAAGHMDGFCAGEPWGERAVREGVGVTVATSQQVWPDHPGKALAACADFAQRHPNTCRALVCAVLEAGRWIDASAANRETASEAIASPAFVNVQRELIRERMLGCYNDGLGHRWHDPHRLRFYGDGAATFPYLSDAMWFMTQHRRWGLLAYDPDYRAVAERVNRLDLYREAAAATNTPLPSTVTRSSRLIDGRTWNGRDPALYAASFAASSHA
ncbi:ABC transporter substrate-binding protein [Massilia solisilvae]|uniref:ABC transporter substrate-binding protein n=1 Tax=Massilia solisilvae TaxID=1811225 RepID=A0ABT2BI65_9BURK|nr:CmpA/NrtA family ABC transporter substrate-binding protein [Massilia solisilvae]MCS0608214.1 ABC transporter substrate-binding protein [Massilia solisilvae]